MLALNKLIFISNNKPLVNHIDGDKTNNNITSLEWCTNSENHKPKCEIGLNSAKKVRIIIYMINLVQDIICLKKLSRYLMIILYLK
ncbi:HNH endonuclease [Romboutsia hominis]|uniref:HNH endonuclease n=1 Tax=Romboutsia hominis TaxID=1507512 RepID=UPI00192D00EE